MATLRPWVVESVNRVKNRFMREHSGDRGRLEDILKYAQNVEQIVCGITYEQFVAEEIEKYYSPQKDSVSNKFAKL